MLKILSVFLFLLIAISCKNSVKESTVDSTVNIITTVDFNEEEPAGEFEAITLNNEDFNSKSLLGKNVVLLIGKANFEGTMSESMNYLFDKKKQDTAKIAFVCIIDGSFDTTEDEITDFVKLYNQDIIFIDNTKVNREGKQINHSIHCWPAKILIDESGKVVHATCGGYGFSEEYEYKLERLLNKKK